MLMGMHGLFKAGLVEWITAMTYQAASGAGAQNMRELLAQMGHLHGVVESLLDDPAVVDPGDRPQSVRSPAHDSTFRRNTSACRWPGA